MKLKPLYDIIALFRLVTSCTMSEKEAVGILIQKICSNSQNIAPQMKSFAELNDLVEISINSLENR